MNTPTHCLVAFAVLAQNKNPTRNWSVLIGALLPDAFIFVAWTWLTFVQGEPQSRIWNEIYFDAPMQLTASVFNSVPLWLGLASLGWLNRTSIFGASVLAFAFAALLHILFDFPVHNHDAYAHFWPVTDWRFISPLSYYESDHYAKYVSIIETIIVGLASYLLWRRFPYIWVKTLILLACLFAGVLTLIHFFLHAG